MGRIIINNEDLTIGMTPGHTYDSIRDFEGILGDIERDLIPTNTGQPFPTVWPEDFEDNEMGKNINYNPFMGNY